LLLFSRETLLGRSAREERERGTDTNKDGMTVIKILQDSLLPTLSDNKETGKEKEKGKGAK
jgi:hypothetical protein